MGSQDPTRPSNNGTPTDKPSTSRPSSAHKNLSLLDGEIDPSNPTRKRNIRPHSPNNPAAMPPADESLPINRGSRKDYNSISPRLSTRSGSQSRTVQEGMASAQDAEREAEREAADVERREGTRWNAFWEKYGSVELENKGSVARDHLALERTFLAWLRTSLSFASIGIAITQLFRLNTSLSPSPPSPSSPLSTPTPSHLRHVGKPLGASFLAIALATLALGFHRYFEAQHYVIRGKFPASRGSVVLVSGVAGGLVVASLVVVLAVGAGGLER